MRAGNGAQISLRESLMTGFTEIFECRNCFHAGILDTHARCERCGSDAVISFEVISLLLLANKVAGTMSESLAIMPMGQA